MSELNFHSCTTAALWQQWEDARRRAVFALHRQLRPAMEDFDAYDLLIAQMLSEGARLVVAGNAEAPLGLALYRIHHNTYQHKLCFLEDLVVAEACRSQGIGAQLLAHLEAEAKRQGCHYLSLDSGTFRTRAHKFYYANNYVADCFHFSKSLR